MTIRLHNRLPRWHRQLIYALTAMLLTSGLGWLVAVYVAAPPGEPTPAPHPWAGPLLVIHGIAAYAALIACALVGHAHLRTGWRVPALRSAAAGLGTSMLVLAATGLVFYYVAAEGAIPFARWTHVGAGVLLPIVLWIHVRRGRRVARVARER